MLLQAGGGGGGGSPLISGLKKVMRHNREEGA